MNYLCGHNHEPRWCPSGGLNEFYQYISCFRVQKSTAAQCHQALERHYSNCCQPCKEDIVSNVAKLLANVYEKLSTKALLRVGKHGKEHPLAIPLEIWNYSVMFRRILLSHGFIYSFEVHWNSIRLVGTSHE